MTGSDLKARRVRLGLTQAELAEALDVSVNAVCLWERGKLRMSPLRARVVAEDLAKLTLKSRMERRGRPRKK